MFFPEIRNKIGILGSISTTGSLSAHNNNEKDKTA